MTDRPIEAAQTSAADKLFDELELVLTDPESSFSPGAWRALKYVQDSLIKLLASAPPAAATVPGHKLTPHQPTKEMLQAGAEQWHRVGTPADAWMAMWHAAPEVATPTAQKAEGGGK